MDMGPSDREALQWLVIAGVCFSLSLGVLRWKEGTFRGQSILMIGLGLVAYAFINATVDLLQEWPNYQPSVSTVVDDWGLPFMSVVSTTCSESLSIPCEMKMKIRMPTDIGASNSNDRSDFVNDQAC